MHTCSSHSIHNRAMQPHRPLTNPLDSAESQSRHNLHPVPPCPASRMYPTKNTDPRYAAPFESRPCLFPPPLPWSRTSFPGSMSPIPCPCLTLPFTSFRFGHGFGHPCRFEPASIDLCFPSGVLRVGVAGSEKRLFIMGC